MDSPINNFNHVFLDKVTIRAQHRRADVGNSSMTEVKASARYPHCDTKCLMGQGVADESGQRLIHGLKTLLRKIRHYPAVVVLVRHHHCRPKSVECS